MRYHLISIRMATIKNKKIPENSSSLRYPRRQRKLLPLPKLKPKQRL
jgi:hypothetical protein